MSLLAESMCLSLTAGLRNGNNSTEEEAQCLC